MANEPAKNRDPTPLERMAYELGFNAAFERPVRRRQGVRREVRVTDDEVVFIEETVVEEEW